VHTSDARVRGASKSGKGEAGRVAGGVFWMWSCVRECVGASGDSMHEEKKRKTESEGTDPEGFILVTSMLHSVVSASHCSWLL